VTAFFVDRDLGPRVGRALRELKVDVTNHADRFAPREWDLTWIPRVTADGLVILTRDAHIRTRPAERAVFEGCGARSFFVTGTKMTALTSVRALLIAWHDMAAIIETEGPGPWMYGISRDGKLTRYIPADAPAGPSARRTALQASRRRSSPSKGQQ
jgi:hypothetical protein